VSECFKWGDPLRCYTPNIINSKKLWRYCHDNVTAKGGCVSRVGAAVMKKSQIYYFRKHEVNDIRNTAATSNCLLTSTWQQVRNILLLNVCPWYFNPLKMKLVYILFKNPVRTSKRAPNFTITKINWLMLFKEMIAVYSENHTKPINTKCSITYCQSRWFI
jgi:endonuclease V-like protein UPF0215 family